MGRVEVCAVSAINFFTITSWQKNLSFLQKKNFISYGPAQHCSRCFCFFSDKCWKAIPWILDSYHKVPPTQFKVVLEEHCKAIRWLLSSHRKIAPTHLIQSSQPFKMLLFSNILEDLEGRKNYVGPHFVHLGWEAHIQPLGQNTAIYLSCSIQSDSANLVTYLTTTSK